MCILVSNMNTKYDQNDVLRMNTLYSVVSMCVMTQRTKATSIQPLFFVSLIIYCDRACRC